MMKFYQSPSDGEICAVRENEAAGFSDMTEIIPNTVDAAREKHVPVISRDGQTVTVTVGSEMHPMSAAHYITWIMLETKNSEERISLMPDDEPVAQFYAAEDDEIIAAYAYCNQHGLWQASPEQ